MNTYDDDRCDNAVNEVHRLRAELADMTEERNKWRRTSSHMSRLHDEAEAAIARVREMCEAHRHGLMSPCAVDIVLEALDGGSE